MSGTWTAVAAKSTAKTTPTKSQQFTLVKNASRPTGSQTRPPAGSSSSPAAAEAKTRRPDASTREKHPNEIRIERQEKELNDLKTMNERVQRRLDDALEQQRADEATIASMTEAHASAEERSSLLSNMIAYTGLYRLEGDRWITQVDVAWNPEWVGTEQTRFFSIDGDLLTVRTPWRVMPNWPEKGLTRSIVRFQRCR